MAVSSRTSAITRLLFVGITIGTGSAITLGGGGELVVGACGNVLWDGVKWTFGKLFGEELLPNLGNPNNDLAKALAIAVIAAVDETRGAYFHPGRRLPTDQGDAICSFLDDVRAGHLAFADDGDDDLRTLLTLEPAEARRRARAAFDKALEGFPESFCGFFFDYFPARVELQFLEQLKNNDPAWRAWQHAVNVGIERSLADLHAKNDRQWNELKNLFEELKAQTRSDLFAKERDERIDALKTLLGEMERRLTGEIRQVGRGVEDLKEEVRQLAARLERALLTHGDLESKHAELQRISGMSEGSIRAFFAIVGEGNIPFDQWPAKLATYAMQIRDMIETGEKGGGRQREAAEAIKAGELDRADAIYAELEAAPLRAAAKATAEVAFFRAERAKLAMARFAYDEAAEHFRTAADMVRPFDDAAEQRYRQQWLDALEAQAEMAWDTNALRQLIDEKKRMVECFRVDQNPTRLFSGLSDLASTVARMGEINHDESALKDALAIFAQAYALPEARIDRLEWAKMAHNYGTVYNIIGHMNRDELCISTAIRLFESALLQYTRNEQPRGWATTQQSLGNALLEQAEISKSEDCVRCSISHLQLALQVRSEWRDTPGQFETEGNLVRALILLGNITRNNAYLGQAVNASREISEKYDRRKQPMLWSMARHNHAGACINMAMAVGQIGYITQAIKAIDEALEGLSSSKNPAQSAVIHFSKGLAYEVWHYLQPQSASLRTAAEEYAAAKSLAEQARSVVLLEHAEAFHKASRTKMATRLGSDE